MVGTPIGPRVRFTTLRATYGVNLRGASCPPDAYRSRGIAPVPPDWSAVVERRAFFDGADRGLGTADLVEAGLTGTEPTNGRVPWRSLADVVPDLVVLKPPDGTLVELIGPLARAARPGHPSPPATAGLATVGLPIARTVPQPNGDTEGFPRLRMALLRSLVYVFVPSAAGFYCLWRGSRIEDHSAAWSTGRKHHIAPVTLPPNSLAGSLDNVGVQAMPSWLAVRASCLVICTPAGPGQVLAQVNVGYRRKRGRPDAAVAGLLGTRWHDSAHAAW